MSSIPNNEIDTSSSAKLRFDARSTALKRRTTAVDAELRKYRVLGATGSLLEAHLITRLGCCGGVPNLVGCGTTCEEVLDLCAEGGQILLLMTESIEKDLGLRLISLIRNRYPAEVKIMFFLQDRSLASRICFSDVDAIILTSSFGTGSVARALFHISRNEKYTDPDFDRALMDCQCPSLTIRERQVLVYLEQGLSNKEIADHLLISSVTVRDYVGTLMRKFDAKNRTLVVANAKNFKIL